MGHQFTLCCALSRAYKRSLYNAPIRYIRKSSEKYLHEKLSDNLLKYTIFFGGRRFVQH